MADSGDSGGQTGEPCPPSFEQALEDLERIVHQLEEGDVGLAEALDAYEKGIGLLKQCYGLLERAERRIELLSGVDAAGNPLTEPFSDEPMSLEKKLQSRSRRSTKAASRTAGERLAANEILAEAADPASPCTENPNSPQVRIDEPGSLF